MLSLQLYNFPGVRSASLQQLSTLCAEELSTLANLGSGQCVPATVVDGGFLMKGESSGEYCNIFEM